MRKIIHNGTLILDGILRIENGYIVINDGVIEEIGEGPAPAFEDTETIDACGNYILPGFIDIHIHGAMGKDFIEGTQEAVDAAAMNVVKDGCTSFMASLTVLSHEEMLNVLDGFSNVTPVENGAHFLGIHEEGPYLSEKYNALMDLRYLRDPSIEEMKEMIAHSGNRIKIMTVAPERKGMREFISYLTNHGITVMMGHSDAKPSDIHNAVEAGAKGFTHLYNAMSQHLHREPGCVTGAMLETGTFAELICDGFHVNTDVVRATYQIFTPKRLVLITDAMLGKGMPNGDYVFSGLNCYKEGKHVRVKETGRIAGSAFGMNDAVLFVKKNCRASMNDIVQMACVNPSVLAQVSDTKGTLAVGKDADIVILDEEIQIKHVFVFGNEVYRK